MCEGACRVLDEVINEGGCHIRVRQGIARTTIVRGVLVIALDMGLGVDLVWLKGIMTTCHCCKAIAPWRGTLSMKTFPRTRTTKTWRLTFILTRILLTENV